MIVVTSIAPQEVTRQSILQEALEMAEHNLMCYSSNLLMTKPKEGFEREYLRNAKKIIVIRKMLEDLK